MNYERFRRFTLNKRRASLVVHCIASADRYEKKTSPDGATATSADAGASGAAGTAIQQTQQTQQTQQAEATEQATTTKDCDPNRTGSSNGTKPGSTWQRRNRMENLKTSKTPDTSASSSPGDMLSRLADLSDLAVLRDAHCISTRFQCFQKAVNSPFRCRVLRHLHTQDSGKGFSSLCNRFLVLHKFLTFQCFILFLQQRLGGIATCNYILPSAMKDLAVYFSQPRVLKSRLP